MAPEGSWSTMELVSTIRGHLEDVEDPAEADRKLMGRVAGKDRGAQQAAMGRLFPRVRRTCIRLLGDTADADDAVQQSLLEILQSSGSFRGLSRLETWADRITTRTALKLSRERARWNSRMRESTETRQVPAVSKDQSATEASPRHPAKYLGDLPERQQTVLVLRHVLDYSIEEIATQTGVSPNTVKDRLLRGRRAIRKQIRRDQSIGVRRRVTS